jgi:hypothetical protein
MLAREEVERRIQWLPGGEKVSKEREAEEETELEEWTRAQAL